MFIIFLFLVPLIRFKDVTRKLSSEVGWDVYMKIWKWTPNNVYGLSVTYERLLLLNNPVYLFTWILQTNDRMYWWLLTQDDSKKSF